MVTITQEAVVLPTAESATNVMEKATSQTCVGHLTDSILGKNSAPGRAEDSPTLTQRDTEHKTRTADQAAETADPVNNPHAQRPTGRRRSSTTYYRYYNQDSIDIDSLESTQTPQGDVPPACSITPDIDEQYPNTMIQLMIKTVNLFTSVTHKQIMDQIPHFSLSGDMFHNTNLTTANSKKCSLQDHCLPQTLWDIHNTTRSCKPIVTANSNKSTIPRPSHIPVPGTPAINIKSAI